MKPVLIFSVLLVMSLTAAKAQTTKWAYDIGDSSDVTFTTGLCTDYNSNVYVAGYYRTSLSVCAGALPTVIPPYGAGANLNTVIAKYDSSGNCKWALVGKALSYYAGGGLITSIKYDGNNYDASSHAGIGNIYVTGKITDSLVYGTDTLHSPLCTHGDCSFGYLLKLDTNGNVLWSQNINGTLSGTPPSLTAMEVVNGNAYLIGSYEDTITIDTCMLTSYDSYTQRGYIAKINGSGHCEWLKNVSDSGDMSSIDAITTDRAGGIYVEGVYGSRAVFPSGPISAYAYYNSFVSKYDTNGNFKWVYGGASKLGNYFMSQAAMKYDNAGHIYLGGDTRDSIRFGTTSYTYPGVSVSVARLDTAGSLDWLYGLGLRSGYLAGTSIAPDDSGFYLLTTFKDTAVVGDSTYIYTSGTTGGQFLLARYDTGRNATWSKSFGGLLEEAAVDITAYKGSIYYTGNTSNSFALDGFSILNHNYSDILLAKMDVPYNNTIPLKSNISVTAGASIFPNPTTGMLHIRSIFDGASEQVYSLTGQLILEKARTGNSADIDLSSLSPGIYFLKDISPQGVMTVKVVKE